MRRAFNLIEIIFTIVIMAGIFAVIPKIIFATNKSDSFAMKQDAFFSTISLINIASNLSWDENNSASTSILNTSGDTIPCNSTTFLRVGGLVGSHTRNCKESISASLIGSDTGEDNYLLYDDIDDFNGSAIDVNFSTKSKYTINTTVEYLNDTIFSVNGNKMTILLDNTISPITTNIKKFKATVRYVGGRGKERNISTFSYYSTNIGQMSLDSEAW